jgi:hypothetical protein
MRRRLAFALLALALKSFAQDGADSSVVMKKILERLDSLEKENKELIESVNSLRAELAASRSSVSNAATTNTKPDEPSLSERVGVEEQRTAEQAQTKVEAAHKFPIQLSGMLLFNAFANSANYTPEPYIGGNLLSGPNRDGATLRQSLLGFEFQGPRVAGDGRVSGFITMDFFGGTSDPLYIRPRLRRAGISIDWSNRSITFGQDKPLISPYQPDSLAEVGVPPLAGAGNLWLWLPQLRYEERLHLRTNTGVTAQVAVMQTEESYENPPARLATTLEPSRPALEGRIALWHKLDDTRRFEFAPGFHVSTTHVGGASVDSHLFSFDWLVTPSSHLQFSGTFFKGENVAALGALGNGFVITPSGALRPVNSTGGWAQVAFPITSRLTLNIYSGLENDRSPFFTEYNLVHNWTYASNVIYHLGPNVVVGLEALQMRTRSFFDVGGRQNHYDLAVGYLF